MSLHRRGLIGGALALPLLGRPARAAGPEPSLAERIGAAVAGPLALTEAVAERVRLAAADNLATLAFTARASKGDHYLHRLGERGGRPEALVLGARHRAPFEDAAAAMAFLVHYSETDDSDFRAELRASPTVFGPALAMAQRPGVTGQGLMEAIAVGYSVLGGLAHPVGPTQDDGLMSAGVWGPSAAAAIAARLMGLDAARTAHALALAAGAAGGTFQYYYDQTEEKRLVVARAARAGVEAALLAQAGEVGPRRAYEGQAGLYNMLARLTGARPDTGGVAAAVARMDGPLYIYPKFFSASSSITPSLEALAPLVAGGLRAADVDRIVLRGDPRRYGVVAAKLGHFEPPATAIGAKINYAYMLAFFLVRGAADAATVAAARIDDPAVLALAARVAFEPEANNPGEVLVHLKSGDPRRVAVANQAPGSVAPVAAQLRAMKIEALGRAALGADGPARIHALAEALPAAPSALRWVRQAQALIAP